MRRLFVLLSLGAALGLPTLAVPTLGVGLPLVGCGGGNDKPPLTPDLVEPPHEGHEEIEAGAAPSAAPTTPPAK